MRGDRPGWGLVIVECIASNKAEHIYTQLYIRIRMTEEVSITGERVDTPIGIKASQTTSSQILLEAVKKNKMSRQERYWITSKIKEVQAHETQLELIRAYQNDPDLFYKLGLIGGGAAAVVGASLMGLTSDGTDPDNNGGVMPSGLLLGEYALIPAGVSFSAFCAFMLAFPRIFGNDGIQLEVSGGGFGYNADFKMG